MKRRPGSDDPAKPKRSAYDKALGLLARREHSRSELKTKLRQGGYEGEETTAAIDRLGEQQYQDDDRFGEVLLRSRIAQGYGPMRLRVELKSHGLGDARIRELLNAPRSTGSLRPLPNCAAATAVWAYPIRLNAPNGRNSSCAAALPPPQYGVLPTPTWTKLPTTAPEIHHPPMMQGGIAWFDRGVAF
jgi:hypothetical protein